MIDDFLTSAVTDMARRMDDRLTDMVKRKTPDTLDDALEIIADQEDYMYEAVMALKRKDQAIELLKENYTDPLTGVVSRKGLSILSRKKNKALKAVYRSVVLFWP